MTLPFHWRRGSVAELIEGIDSGKNLRCEERPPLANETGIVKISAVTWGTFDPSKSKTVASGTQLPDSTRIRAGDLLISRANTLELVGATVLVEETPTNLHLSDKVLRLRAKAGWEKWLNLFLNSFDGRNEIESRATGNQLSMRNIGQAAIRSLAIPVPPLAEQRRIVALIEALFARTRCARADLKRIALLSAAYRQRVLEQLFADAIEKSRTVPLGSLLTAIEAGKNMRCDERRPRPGENGIVKISAVTWGRFDPAAIKTAPTDAVLDPRSRIADGDFLMSRANTLELVGAPVIAQDVPADTFLSDKVLRLRFREPVEKWVLWFLRSPTGRHEIEARSSGNQLSMRNIGQGALRNIPIPLPSLNICADAIKTIERGEERTAIADRQATRALALLDRLEQSILARAFRGELVS